MSDLNDQLASLETLTLVVEPYKNHPQNDDVLSGTLSLYSLTHCAVFIIFSFLCRQNCFNKYTKQKRNDILTVFLHQHSVRSTDKIHPAVLGCLQKVSGRNNSDYYFEIPIIFPL